MEQAALQVQTPADQTKDTIAELYAAHPLSLDASKNIRLLTKASSTTANPQDIEFGINVISLSDNPEYTALSYVWGTDEPSQIIRINGKAFSVRQNLFDFLQEYWRRNESCTLWIDAICINQSSVPERNHQVAMMGQIYSQASSVISWLGAGPPELVDAFRRITDPDYKEQGVPNVEYKLGRVLEKAEYWHRAWITQEFCLAKTVDIWFGREIRSDGSIRLPRQYSENSLCTVGLRIFDLIQARETFRGSRASKHTIGFFLIHHGELAHGRCSDVRDRIFSLLALCDPKKLKEHPVVIDYNASPAEIFIDLARSYARDPEELEDNNFRRELVRVLKVDNDPVVTRYLGNHPAPQKDDPEFSFDFDFDSESAGVVVSTKYGLK